MRRLRRGMYGTQHRRKRGLFGLRCGQLSSRGDKAVHNGGWYNSRGEKIGWGDLSYADLRRIAKGLRKDELVLILSERDSYWEFTTFTPEFAISRRERKPGVRYVAGRCFIIVMKGNLLYVSYDDLDDTDMPVGGEKFTPIKRKDVQRLMREKRG